MSKIDLRAGFHKERVPMQGAVFAYRWEPVGSSPLIESYTSTVPSGPKWRWANRVTIYGSHVPRVIFDQRLTQRWSLHISYKQRLKHHGGDRISEHRWHETVFWFESDEDFLLMKLMGMFEGERPILMKHERAKPKQEEMFFNKA